MDEIERPEEVGEVVTPQQETAADPELAPEQRTEEGALPPAEGGRDRTRRQAQSREENRRYQAARHSGERSGYERALRELGERNGTPEDEEARRAEFIRQDAERFLEKYPRVDLRTLDTDETFRRFCGSRYGKEPLAELFEDYLEVSRLSAERARASAESRSRRATGSGGGAGSDTLTAAQQRDLDEWNRTYPGMKMTAKEFLSR